MLKIGITGGIGSGKSMVSEVFRLYDIPVYDADMQAKRLNDTSPEIRRKLIAHFGTHIYTDSTLNKSAFAAIIFNHPDKLKLANAIIHPHLLADFEEWAKKRCMQPMVAMDAAILFEAGFQPAFDKIVSVFAPQNMRIRRAVARDNTSQKTIEARMKNQMPEEDKIKQSDFVIVNDTRHSLLQQVDETLKALRFR